MSDADDPEACIRKDFSDIMFRVHVPAVDCNAVIVGPAVEMLDSKDKHTASVQRLRYGSGKRFERAEITKRVG